MENSIELKTRNMKSIKRFLLSLALGLLLSFTFGTKAKAEVTVDPKREDSIHMSGNVSGQELAQYSGQGKGISLDDNTVLTLDNADELSFTAIAAYEDLEIKGSGKLKLTITYADAINVKKLILSGGVIYSDMGLQADEIYINDGVDLTIIPNFDGALYSHNKIVINGGKITIDKVGYPAIWSIGTIEIKGGEMNLISTKDSAISAEGDISITGGTIQASSEKSDKYGIETNGILTVDETKATITATAKDKNGVREFPTKSSQNDTDDNKSTTETSQEVKAVTPEPTENINTEPAENINPRQKKASLSKSKADKKSITLTWKKVTAKGIKGYEIQYSTDKNFSKDVTKTVTIKKVKTTKTKIKKLKSKTKYYVRIRTYSVKNGEKVYSKWSTKKSVKVK